MKEHVTQTEAQEILGIHYLTFKKYATMLGISGEKVGKERFYTTDEVEKIRAFTDKGTYVGKLVKALEKATGRKVILQ